MIFYKLLIENFHLDNNSVCWKSIRLYGQNMVMAFIQLLYERFSMQEAIKWRYHIVTKVIECEAYFLLFVCQSKTFGVEIANESVCPPNFPSNFLMIIFIQNLCILEIFSQQGLSQFSITECGSHFRHELFFVIL